MLRQRERARQEPTPQRDAWRAARSQQGILKADRHSPTTATPGDGAQRVKQPRRRATRRRPVCPSPNYRSTPPTDRKPTSLSRTSWSRLLSPRGPNRRPLHPVRRYLDATGINRRLDGPTDTPGRQRPRALPSHTRCAAGRRRPSGLPASRTARLPNDTRRSSPSMPRGSIRKAITFHDVDEPVRPATPITCAAAWRRLRQRSITAARRRIKRMEVGRLRRVWRLLLDERDRDLWRRFWRTRAT